MPQTAIPQKNEKLLNKKRIKELQKMHCRKFQAEENTLK
jgi:hypothetical protein